MARARTVDGRGGSTKRLLGKTEDGEEDDEEDEVVELKVEDLRRRVRRRVGVEGLGRREGATGASTRCETEMRGGCAKTVSLLVS